jgi:plastocyanin
MMTARGKMMALVWVCAALGASGADAAAATAKTPKPRPPAKQAKPVVVTVKVNDDFFLPTKVTIHEGSSVRWVWGPDIDVHNVTLASGPKGVNKRQFTSVSGSTALVFKRKFTVPGTYKFICTIHAMMKMTVTVKK